MTMPVQSHWNVCWSGAVRRWLHFFVFMMSEHIPIRLITCLNIGAVEKCVCHNINDGMMAFERVSSAPPSHMGDLGRNDH